MSCFMNISSRARLSVVMNLGELTFIFYEFFFSGTKFLTFMMSNWGTKGSTFFPSYPTNLVCSNSVPRWSSVLTFNFFSRTLFIQDSYIFALIVLPFLCLRDSFSKLNSTSASPLSVSITLKYTLTVPSGIGLICFCLP